MRKIKLRNYYLMCTSVLIVGNSEHNFPDSKARERGADKGCRERRCGASKGEHVSRDLEKIFFQISTP